MTGQNPIVITREELYEQVWVTPMRHLAKQFGLSDVGLRKCCTRHEIPTPQAGYWAQKAAGKARRRPQLKPPSDSKLMVIRITPTPATSTEPQLPVAARSFDPELGKLAEKELQRTIVVPTVLRNIHPIVQRTYDSLNKFHNRGAMPGDPIIKAYGIDGNYCVNVSVAKTSIRRAVLLLHAIVRECQERGYQIRDRTHARWERSDEGLIEAFGCRFDVAITERTKRSPHVLTESEKRNQEKGRWQYSIPNFDYEPTGLLRIELSGRIGSYHHEVIQDSKIKVEEKLSVIFQAIVGFADSSRRQKAEKAEAERRQYEEAERRRIEEELRRQEQGRVTQLLDEADRWSQAQRLRGYLAEVREQISKLDNDIERPAMAARLLWAERIACSLDPLTSLKAWDDPHFAF